MIIMLIQMVPIYVAINYNPSADPLSSPKSGTNMYGHVWLTTSTLATTATIRLLAADVAGLHLGNTYTGNAVGGLGPPSFVIPDVFFLILQWLTPPLLAPLLVLGLAVNILGNIKNSWQQP